MRFSVIVPIYNVESYLAECIESVLAQGFSDYELILVDDGSPDNCGRICDEYAKKDGRIRVIHKENGGLVSARKAGIKIAAGEYVVNLDSDDKFAPEMLEKADEIIREYEADLISFSIEFFDEKSSDIVFESAACGLYKKSDIEEKIYPKMLLSENMEHMFYFLCAKVIKRSVLTEPQLAVDEDISYGEDVSCLIRVYPRCERVYISDYTAYICRRRIGSDSRAFRLAQFPQLAAGIRLLESVEIAGYDLAAQVDRYTAFSCFVLLQSAALAGAKNQLARIEGEILSEPFFSHIRMAQFGKISPKSRIVYALFKDGKIRAAYRVLKICNFLKGR